MLYQALVLGQPIYPIMVLFWVENIVIGGVTVLELCFSQSATSGTGIGKFFKSLGFSLIYGAFTSVHGLFVLLFFGFKDRDFDTLIRSLSTGSLVKMVTSYFQAFSMAVDRYQLNSTVFAIVAGHLLAFVKGFLLSGECKRADVEGQSDPFKQIFVLQGASLLAAFSASGPLSSSGCDCPCPRKARL